MNLRRIALALGGALTLVLAMATTARAVDVTFQVNMAIQKLIGNFDPEWDSVEVHGSFDGWGAGIILDVSQTDLDIYETTFDIFDSAGAVIEYKFVMYRSGILVWEGNVGPGGGTGNRTFVLEETSQTLPVVYFDNVDRDPGAGIAVTFVVHMGVQAALGLFDPDLDTVTLAGQFNNWNESDTPLANSPEDPYVYRGTVTIQGLPGSSIAYKFLVNGGVWEDGDNRTFVMAESDQTLPLVFFNRQDDLGTLTISATTSESVTLEWTAGLDIRLQTTASLTSEWEDVPGTTGQASATVPVSDHSAFFRLTGP